MRKLLFSIGLLAAVPVMAQNARRLHKKAIVVDTHNDVLSSATMHGLSIEQDLSGKTHSDLARFKKGGIDVQVFSIFCDEQYGKGTAFNYASREIDSLYAIASRNPERITIVQSPAELKKAVKQHKLAAMIGVEGGHMIEGDLGKLDSLFSRGARYLTLTWNNSTEWASSAKDETEEAATLSHKGLTEFGKQVVRKMNELGMMVDLSHTGEETFRDAINVSTKPVILSHSSVYRLCPVYRNLKDDQIKAVGRNGGVIQLNFYSGFLDSNYRKRLHDFMQRHQSERDSLLALKKPGYEINEFLAARYPQEANELRAPFSLLFDHLDYIVKMVGIDHVGLGSDFDGIESPPQRLDDVSDYPLITAELLRRGYSKKDIRKVLGGNFLRVFLANAAATDQR